MGLDAVELVMEVEDRFEISIGDDEASNIRTVGDLVNLVESRIAATRAKICPTLQAFLQLRSDVRDVSTSPKLRIRPSEFVSSTLSPCQRRGLWRKLENRMGGTATALERPTFVFYAILASVLAVAIAPMLLDAAVLPLSLFVAAILLFFLLVATKPLCIVPPRELATFGQLARSLAGRTASTAPGIASRDSQWVFETVRDIIVNQLGVKRESVVPNASFVKDLGID